MFFLLFYAVSSFFPGEVGGADGEGGCGAGEVALSAFGEAPAGGGAVERDVEADMVFGVGGAAAAGEPSTASPPRALPK